MVTYTSTDQLVVFVSYSRAQVHFADELELYLSNQNHKVLLDRHGISKGEDFQERLGEMILESDTVVFILSDESAMSKVCAWEIEEATRLSKRILVVTLSDLSEGIPAPQALAGIDWIHCWNNPAVPGSSQTKGLIELDTALRTDVHWLRQCTEYQRQAANWARRGKKKESPILLRDDLLAEALDFAQNTPANEDLPEEVAEFFGKSSEYQATLNSTAVTRAKAVRRTGLIGAFVSAVFFLVAMGFGYVALQQRDAAVAERNEATLQSNLSFSRALAAQAATEQDGDLDLSLLLSIEAFAAAPTAEARSALMSGLTRIPHVDQYLRTSQEVGSGAVSDNYCSLSHINAPRTFAAPSTRETGVLDVFEMPSGRRSATLPIEASNAVALSADGAMAAFYAETGVKIVDLETQQTLAETPMPSGYGCILFNETADRLYFSNEANVYAWAFQTDAVPDAMTVPSLRSIYRISPSASGAYWLASGYAVGGNRKATVWLNFDTQEILGEVPDSQIIAHDRRRDVAAIANADGLYAFQLGADSSVQQTLSYAWSDFEFGVAALSPTRDEVAIWDQGKLSLFNLETGEATVEQMDGYSGAVEAMLFEPDGRHFITMGRDDTLTRWSTAARHRLMQTIIEPESDRLADLPEIFSGPLTGAEAGWLYSGSLEALQTEQLDVLVQLLTDARAPEPAPLPVTAAAEEDGASEASLLPAPRDVLDAFDRLDPATYQSLASLSPDHTLIAAITQTQQVQLLDARSLDMVAESAALGVTLKDLSLLSSARLLAVSEQGAVWQCDRDGAALTCAAFAEQPPRESLQILPGLDDRQAYALGYEEISLLDLEAGRLITNLARGSGMGAPASASLDEAAEVLAFSRGLGCVALYDPNLVFPFAGELCPPSTETFSMSSGLAFNETGDILLTGHTSGIILWNLAPETLIEQACGIANRNLSPSEWLRYMGDRPLRQTC
ncbi:MAG: toll/interleukin-1 receptor domain-containing protein [Pseudomonadota bacterium]